MEVLDITEWLRSTTNAEPSKSFRGNSVTVTIGLLSSSISQGLRKSSSRSRTLV